MPDTDTLISVLKQKIEKLPVVLGSDIMLFDYQCNFICLGIDEFYELKQKKMQKRTPSAEAITHRKLAMPKWGTYMKYPPLNTFEFFIIGDGIGPRVIRLGKKMAPVVASYTKCEEVKEKSGEFRPSHPVNWYDIKETHQFHDGSVIMQPWVPLIVSARLEGHYYRCSYIDEFGRKREATIAKPNPERYPMVFH